MQKSTFLMSCPVCRRQYDVTHYEAGRTIRCECSVVFTVEDRKPRSPRPLKCFHCGGPLEEKSARCRFCESEISLEERRLDSLCPRCLARTVSNARFCMECGVKLQAQEKQGIPEDAHCPRCKGALQWRSLSETSLIECSSCAGLWLHPGVFEKLCATAEECLREFSGRTSAPPAAEPREESKVQYLPCVVCSDLMVRRNFGGRSGILIDWCKNHGIWFDHQELQRVLEFVQKGGLEEARRMEREREERRARLKKINEAEPQSYYSDWTASISESHDDTSSWLSFLLIIASALARCTFKH